MSLLSKRTRPPLAVISRRMILPRVVLPLPLSPISVTTSPGLMSKLTWRRAGKVPPPSPAARNSLETWSRRSAFIS